MAPPLFGQRGNVMYYAALGDISGAPHEFNRFNTDKYDYEFIQEEHTNPYTGSKHYQQPYKNRCSDDTILSMAVAKAIMEVGDDLDKLERTTTKYLKEYARQYPNDGITFPGLYGDKFINWANSSGLDSMTGRPSFGNGSAMRVSAVGWAYNSLEKTLKAAEKTALPSHGHPEAIKGAQAIASAIYLARAGVSMADIKAFLETKFDYDLDIAYEKYQYYNKNELKKQSEFCQTTVPMAICAFLNSTDENGKGYEDCVRKAVNICGDSDTIGAMAGSIAGAYYGMTKEHETKCESLLNDHLNGVAKEFQQFVASRHTEPDKAELEAVLTKARLESYLLQQAKSKSPFTQEKAEKVFDLLTKSEAARLFYEQVKAARQKNDNDLEQKLLGKREEIVKALEEKCKESPELLKKWQAMKSWPVKQVKVVDVDEMVGRRKSGVPKTLPQRRAVVDHQAVAKLGMTRCGVVDEVLAEKVGKKPEMPVKPKRASFFARPFLSLYHLFKGDYKSFSQKMAEYNEDVERVGRINALLEEKSATENGLTTENTEKTVTAEKETGVNQATTTVAKEEKKEQAASREDGTLSRQILDVNRALEVVRLNISVEIQTQMRQNGNYSMLQEIGHTYFEKKVESYLAQVQSGKIQPNTAFMETIAKPEKFDDVYQKWLFSEDGIAFSEKFYARYSHTSDLREAIEANPVLKSKLDANANIHDDKEFGEKLVAEDPKVHQKFLNTALNVMTDGEMKMMLTNFSFINEFQAPAIEAQQPAEPTTELTQPDVSAQNDVNANTELNNIPG